MNHLFTLYSSNKEFLDAALQYVHRNIKILDYGEIKAVDNIYLMLIKAKIPKSDLATIIAKRFGTVVRVK